MSGNYVGQPTKCESLLLYAVLIYRAPLYSGYSVPEMGSILEIQLNLIFPMYKEMSPEWTRIHLNFNLHWEKSCYIFMANTYVVNVVEIL